MIIVKIGLGNHLCRSRVTPRNQPPPLINTTTPPHNLLITQMANIYHSTRSGGSHCYTDRSFRISIISPSSARVPSPVVSLPSPVLSKPRQSNKHKTDAARVFATLLEAHRNAPLIQRPIIVREVSQRAWDAFRDAYGEHPEFKASK